MVVDWAFAQGWGLSACWFSTASFMALRLLMNGVRLLGPGSVLSRTEALSDKMEDLEGKAAALAAATGTSLTDTESDDSEADAPTAATPPPAVASLTMRKASTGTPLSLTELNRGRGVDGRPGGRGRVEWSWDVLHMSADDELAMSPEEGGQPGAGFAARDVLAELGRPGGRACEGGGDVPTWCGVGVEETSTRTSVAAAGAGLRGGNSAVGLPAPADEADSAEVERIGGMVVDDRPGGRARAGWPGDTANMSVDGEIATVAEEGGEPGADSAKRDVIEGLGSPGGRTRGGGGDALTSGDSASTRIWR